MVVFFRAAPPVSFTLTAADRCDLCGARAYIRALISVFHPELLFCAHHGHEMEEALRSVALDLVDESAALLEQPDIPDVGGQA